MSFSIKGIKFYVEHAKNPNKLTYSLFKGLLGALGGALRPLKGVLGCP